MAFGCFGFLGAGGSSGGAANAAASKSKKVARTASNAPQKNKSQSQSQSQKSSQGQAQAQAGLRADAEGGAAEGEARPGSGGTWPGAGEAEQRFREGSGASAGAGTSTGAGTGTDTARGSGAGEGPPPLPPSSGSSHRRSQSFKKAPSRKSTGGSGPLIPNNSNSASNSGPSDPDSFPGGRRDSQSQSFETPPLPGERVNLGPGLPRVNSRDRGGGGAGTEGGEGGNDFSRNRSNRRQLAGDKSAPQAQAHQEQPSGSSSWPSPLRPGGGGGGGGEAMAPQVAGRGSMKITQNLKAPPAKAPQPQFSLSKKRPKDAAAEALLQQETSKLDDLLKSSDLRAFSYSELKAATRGWSMDTLIGAGGFGKVYRGVVRLPPPHSEGAAPANADPVSVEVAIKRLEAKSLQGHKEWMVEICMLGLVNHGHLVKLLGFCAEGEKRLLVYEFLPYYSLDRYLFAIDPSQPILDWDTRLKIALGSARGLAHLHEEISPPIIYRDFKTSNILLDEDFNPKLSDFGLAREGPSLDRTHVSTQVRGTAGYAAPEYMLTGHLTPKADVWSFGVVLLEMLTGRPSIDQRRPQNEMKLVPLARQRLQAPGDILELMDPNLEGQYPPPAAAKLAEVAKWCLQSDPGNRPLMSELVEVLAYLSRPEMDPA